jgi:glycosyltransferase involved in cell wall biosynthesis
LRILQVSSSDIAGGAEKVAFDLFRAYRRRHLNSWLAVGVKHSEDPDVIAIPNSLYRTRWAKSWLRFDPEAPSAKPDPPVGRLRSKIAEPWRTAQQLLGREDFEFPGSRQLPGLTPQRPTIIHGHNLHGDYFDLRVLPQLSDQLPVFLTLHDAWLLSGHCSHSFDCEKWKAGCGDCPDLTIYPAIRRDATHANWRRKQEIFGRSQFYLATPSQWLMDKVKQSILAPAIREAKVIPYGIDLSVFKPQPKSTAREALTLPADAKVLLFAANGIRKSIWKDFTTMRKAVADAATKIKSGKICFVALGEDGPNENLGGAEIRFIPYQRDPKQVALFYQAADIYVHAARADTFPNVVLEAMACGLPVVGTAVGGIPEQIDHGKTGFLVPRDDPHSMTQAIIEVLENDSLRLQLGETAAGVARARFDLDREVNDYLAWYEHSLSLRSAG